MLRSMYSGISGMKANQTKLDVIGNNIANVSTTSYKSSRATFADMLSQNSKSATGSSATKGGTNAQQVGLGVQLASIDKIMTQGSMQSTSRALDIAIDGNGYFMVATGPVISGDGDIAVSQSAHQVTSISGGSSISYTRDGSFTVDNEGNLLTTSGYRVLGYSVTNDDSTQKASAVEPNSVQVAGLNFKFSAGTQLNGYTIQLGTIAKDTPANATVDEKKKIIKIDGDFSPTSKLEADTLAKKINDALAGKGISQKVTATGKISPIEGTSTDNSIANGQDAAAPGSVTCFGYVFNFDKGEKFNDYTIQMGDISQTNLEAQVNGKVIIINGNFTGDSKYQASAIEEAVNKALAQNKISEKITVKSGNGVALNTLKGTINSVNVPALSKTKYGDGSADSVLGFKINSTRYGNELTTMPFEFVNDTTKSGKIDADLSNGKLVIKADFTKANSTDIANAINGRLSLLGISAEVEVTGSYANNGITSCSFEGGVGSETPSVKIGGFTVNLPSTDKLASIIGKTDTAAIQAAIESINKLDFVINKVNKDGKDIECTFKGNTLSIEGDFSAQGSISNSAFQEAIGKAIADHLGLTGTKKDTFVSEVKATGQNTNFNNATSEKVKGGTTLKGGDPIVLGQLTLKPSPESGAALNGYSIQFGDIQKDTPEVTVDKSKKKIVISGNFATDKAIDLKTLEGLLNKKMADTFGPEVKFEMAGTVPTFNGTKSDEVTGGTSVQSMDTAGNINFVSGTGTVYAYDDSLKTLRIPEAVTLGDGTTSAVQSYSISDQGVIIATLANGDLAALGQIALANFSNPAGLQSAGGNLFNVSANSGAAQIMSGINTSKPENDNSKSFGAMNSGFLEMSNVDLAEQFTDMITATKAFQGSSKMITTGDEILSEIINLKR